MLNNYNIDKIVSSLTKTVEALDKAKQKYWAQVEQAQADIDAATSRRNHSAAEATRAEKISANVKKLLDIS